MHNHAEIDRALQAIAREAFPDNQDVHWEIREVIQRRDFSCVEAEPVPATVGYPRFRFVFRRASSGAYVDHGCYCLDQGRWQLLYSTPDTSDDWKSLKFDGAV